MQKQKARREAGLSAAGLTLSVLASGQRFFGFFGLMGFVTGSISDPALATDEAPEEFYGCSIGCFL